MSLTSLIPTPLTPYIWAIKLGAIAVAVFAVFGAGTYAGIRWESSKVAALQIQIAETSSKANQATVDAIQKSVTNALAANAQTQQKAQEREQQTAALIERLSHVPTTSSCVRSPAISTYLNGLRNGRPNNH